MLALPLRPVGLFQCLAFESPSKSHGLLEIIGVVDLDVDCQVFSEPCSEQLNLLVFSQQFRYPAGEV